MSSRSHASRVAGLVASLLLHTSLVAARPASASEAPAVEWFGYAQLTAEHTDGDSEFGADRVRAGARLSSGRVTATLQLDLNADDLDSRPAGTLPNIIKDVFVEYRLREAATVRLGQFKAPLGMDFLLPGHSLDITKRGMEKALVLERDLGLMLSGRRLPGGIGYDVGVFNVAGRSAATAHVGSGPDDQTGKDHAWAARLLYDPAPAWHFEGAAGGSESAGGPGTSDYRVFDAGVRFVQHPWTAKAEHISGHNVRGERGRDERVGYAHVGYAVSEATDLVVRHYQGRSSASTGATSLGNTYIGASYRIRETTDVATRVQLNYVVASGDGEDWTGSSGFRKNALLLQVQVSYLP